MNTTIMSISPALAKDFLEKNMVNRNINEFRVRAYAIDMKEGNWQLNGESIKFNKKGELIDGQHRLSAIIRSNKTIPMCVTTDVSNDITLIDRGRNRSTKDTLQIGGMSKDLASNNIIGVVKLHFSITKSVTNLTDSQVEEFILKHRDTFEILSKLCTNRGGNKQKQLSVRSAVVMLPMFYALEAGISEDIIRDFLEVFRSGFYERRDQSAAIVCRNDMLGKVLITNGTAAEKKASVYKIEKALDDFSQKKERVKSYNSWNYPVFSSKYKEANDE